MASNGFDLFYRTSKSDAKVDFISRIGEDIVPIEVKASTNNRSRSLKVFLERYHPRYALRITQKNFGFENLIKSVPLYATFCIQGCEVPSPIKSMEASKLSPIEAAT